MNYKSTEKALRNKYKDKFSNVLLCLLKQYSPAMTSSIVDQLNIDKSVFNECPVIYKDLGVPDDFNSDNPFEISPLFLQRYVDSIIGKYTSINDRFERRKYLHTVLKPMLVPGAVAGFTDEDIEDKPVDPKEFYDRNKDSINDLLITIYDNSSELETLKLSREEIELVNFIHIIYFGLSNTFYFSDLLKDIYNELLRIRKERNISFIEEAYYIFKNTLYSKIKNKQYSTNKIDDMDKSYTILPTKLEQSYKRGKPMNLKSYLQNKLSITFKEAELIESVVSSYVRKNKQSRMEEGLWDDVKDKAKSLIGKGKKKFDPTSIIKLQSNGSLYRVMKDILLFTKEEIMSGESGNISFDFPRIYKENSEDMYQYINSLGISYNPEILDMWKKYGSEVKKFYKLFLGNSDSYTPNDIRMEHEVFEYLNIKLPLINDSFRDKDVQDMLELLINKPIDRNSLNAYFERKLSRYRDLDDKVTDIKRNVSYIKDLDYRLEVAFKYLLFFIRKEVKEQFDSLIYIPETIDAKKYFKIKNELYKIFKYFYPNEPIQEITKKLNISKQDSLRYTQDNPPTEDFMKSSMATKEKTLKNYLQNKLSITPKEAELIESVVRGYVKKDTTKLKEYASFYSALLSAIREEQDSILEGDKTVDDFIPKLEEIKSEEAEKTFGKKRSMNIQYMWDMLKSMSSEYKTEYKKRNDPKALLELEYKEIYEKKFGIQKENTKSLKSYLQKRLTINSKEAELIESAVRKYVRAKR